MQWLLFIHLFFYYFIRPTWHHCLLLTYMYICSTCSFQTFFFNQLCRSCHALCLQTIGVSLLLPVVKGKQSQLALFLPSRTVTIPPGSLPKKVSRAQRMWNTLPQGCLTDLCQAFTFSIYCCLHWESDCMLSAWCDSQRSFTFEWLVEVIRTVTRLCLCLITLLYLQSGCCER